MDKKSRNRQVVVPADMKRYDRQLHRLSFITKELVEYVNDKDIQYGSSWRKRGGAGSFMVMARKWDRIEQACEKEPAKYDIFNVFKEEDRRETILDDCLDLVGYLLILVEHMIEIGHVTGIKELHMSFVSSTPMVESEPSGMTKPFGFEEEEEDLIEDLILDTDTRE
ncbi:hypothetical protein LCGC14_1972360 [marine sediment metagenome]|uniref:Uncharacterized protein n=1 Tax=marine sediment metagenome TaxID=412755 RepID=A0A0F9FBS9_9ZZZZ